MGGMPKEISSLDLRVTSVEAILPTLATKADLSEARADIIKWSAGMAISSAAIIVATLGLIITRTYPAPAAAQPSAAPIIVYPQLSTTAAPPSADRAK